MAETYLNEIQRALPRVISMLDREPLSLTHGCFDRTYWCWKFTDFPGARFQEGIYTLSHLWAHPLPDNGYHQNPRTLQWIKAAINYWCSIQRRDGSFDEAYPRERSLAATAFTLFYVGEALELLKEQFDETTKNRVLKAVAGAARWLCLHDETHGLLTNHLAAAAAALDIAARLTNEDLFSRRCNYFLERIYRHQSPEGWYEEYGGADPGYQTHATFYLARVWQKRGDQHLDESLSASLKFLRHFVHADGSIGGEYASRGTAFFFPAGFEILASKHPEAAAIASFMRPFIGSRRHTGLPAMDAFNIFPMLNNYLFAATHAEAIGTTQTLPHQEEGVHLFPDAGLQVTTTSHYQAVAGFSKGGVIKVYRHDGEDNASDCGYWGRLKGKAFTSQVLNTDIKVSGDEGESRIQVPMGFAKQKVFSPFLFLGFRGFMWTLGRFPRLARFVKNLLVRTLVVGKKSVGLRLSRTFYFETKQVVIKDVLEKDKRVNVSELYAGHKFTAIHMGSSRYDLEEETRLPPEPGKNLAPELMQQGRVSRSRIIAFP